MIADERSRLGEWRASDVFAAAHALAIEAAADGAERQRERWDLEAAEVATHAATVPQVEPDPEAARILTRFRRAEAKGWVRWDGTDWVPTTRPAQRSTTPQRREPLTWGFFVDRLDGFRFVAPGRGRSRCPAHGGTNPSSFSIQQGHSWWLLTCFSEGCPTESIAAALGLTVADLDLGDDRA